MMDVTSPASESTSRPNLAVRLIGCMAVPVVVLAVLALIAYHRLTPGQVLEALGDAAVAAIVTAAVAPVRALTWSRWRLFGVYLAIFIAWSLIAFFVRRIM